jgi:hypothetical protein
MYRVGDKLALPASGWILDKRCCPRAGFEAEIKNTL